MIVKIAAMDVKLNSYPVNIKKPIEAVKSCIKDNIAPTLNLQLNLIKIYIITTNNDQKNAKPAFLTKSLEIFGPTKVQSSSYEGKAENLVCCSSGL